MQTAIRLNELATFAPAAAPARQEPDLGSGPAFNDTLRQLSRSDRTTPEHATDPEPAGADDFDPPATRDAHPDDAEPTGDRESTRQEPGQDTSDADRTTVDAAGNDEVYPAQESTPPAQELTVEAQASPAPLTPEPVKPTSVAAPVVETPPVPSGEPGVTAASQTDVTVPSPAAVEGTEPVAMRPDTPGTPSPAPRIAASVTPVAGETASDATSPRPVEGTQRVPTATQAAPASQSSVTPRDSGSVQTQVVPAGEAETRINPDQNRGPSGAARLAAARGAEPAPPPAAARAQQVDQSVRLERTTGQSAQLSHTLTVEASVRGGAETASDFGQSGGDQRSATGNSAANTIFDRTQSADDRQFARPILRGLSAMLNQRGGIMTMRLDPPELGQLRIEMQLNRGVVEARFQTTNPMAQELLERNMSALRTALEARGLTVDRLTVQPSGPASSSTTSNAGQQDGASQQQHDAGGQESRGQRGESGAGHGRDRAESSFEQFVNVDPEAGEPGVMTAGGASP